MKKLFLSLIAVAVGTLGSFAQDDLVATLGTGSSLLTFTGADALSEAYTAASDGDVITLSPGVFNAVTIEKATTIRGAGMLPLESNGYVSTQITGDLNINVPSSSTYVPTIEGIHILDKVNVTGTNLTPINLSKCRLEGAVSCFGTSVYAFSCIFAKGLTAIYYKDNGYENTTITCLNSVINLVSSSGYNTEKKVLAKIVANNCVGYHSGGLPNSSLTNCIIIGVLLSGTCTAQNCVGITADQTSYPNIFRDIQNTSNMMVEGTMSSVLSSVFKTIRFWNSSSIPTLTETFELTETAAATYLGEDDTQVGIYGGSMPYNPTPSNPQVKTFNVTNTAEGDQLRVKINVE